MDAVCTLKREEFDRVYNSFAPLAYGVACRIAPDEELASQILIETFLDLYNRGVVKQTCVKEVLAATFKSIGKVLKGSLPTEDIQRRIQRERARLIPAKQLKARPTTLVQ